MKNPELGKLIIEEAERDAIHVAIYPAIAGEKLRPGEHVRIDCDGEAFATNHGYGVGIVDPFLSAAEVIRPGMKFWVCIYPNTITSLRHDWILPGIEDIYHEDTKGTEKSASKEESERWLRNFCADADCPGYEAVMRAIKEDHPDDGDGGYFNTNLDDEYLHFGGSDAHGEIPPEFWEHVKNVLGYEPRARAKSFSCSC